MEVVTLNVEIRRDGNGLTFENLRTLIWPSSAALRKAICPSWRGGDPKWLLKRHIETCLALTLIIDVFWILLLSCGPIIIPLVITKTLQSLSLLLPFPLMLVPTPYNIKRLPLASSTTSSRSDQFISLLSF